MNTTRNRQEKGRLPLKSLVRNNPRESDKTSMTASIYHNLELRIEPIVISDDKIELTAEEKRSRFIRNKINLINYFEDEGKEETLLLVSAKEDIEFVTELSTMSITDREELLNKLVSKQLRDLKY